MALSEHDQLLLDIFIKEILGDKRIVGVVLFGSALEQEIYRDIDLALISSEKLTAKQKLSILLNAPDKFDVKFLEDLPLYVAKDTIKGKLLVNRNNNVIFDVFVDIIKKWEDFKPLYELYLDVVANGL